MLRSRRKSRPAQSSTRTEIKYCMWVVVNEKDSLLTVLRPADLDNRGFHAIRNVMNVVDVNRILDSIFFRQRIECVKISRSAVVLENGDETSAWGSPLNYRFASNKYLLFGSDDDGHMVR